MREKKNSIVAKKKKIKNNMLKVEHIRIWYQCFICLMISLIQQSCIEYSRLSVRYMHYTGRNTGSCSGHKYNREVRISEDKVNGSNIM